MFPQVRQRPEVNKMFSQEFLNSLEDLLWAVAIPRASLEK